MENFWLTLMLTLILINLVQVIDGAKFLAFVPMPVKSHQRVIQPYLGELARRGHEVVCYSPHLLENPPKNYKGIKMPDLFDEVKKNLMGGEETKDDYSHMTSTWANIITSFVLQKVGLHFSDLLFKTKQFQELNRSNETFDAVILETSIMQESMIALGHRFNAPVIEIIPSANHLWAHWLYGNPYDTSYICDIFLPFTNKLTFPQRLVNTVFNGLTRLIFSNYFMPLHQQQIDEQFRYSGWENRPPIMDMIVNTSLVLVNTHFSVNYPQPNSPNFIEVGGMNIVEPKPLPKDLQDFMDNAKDGVIYFTLGSHIPVSAVLGMGLKDIFLQVFSELKQKVLWKWETEFPNLPSNIKISKWFPQQDLLAHKHLKLFITHGGLLSTTEAVYQGVPTIGIPVMGDQRKNVVHMEHYKYGIPLYLENITYTSLKWAIDEVLNNPEYKINAKKRSEMYRDQPRTALETAVYWTEYVIRHNGAHHLKPAISTMPWYQQAMIDVYATIAAIILIPLYISIKILKSIINRLCCRSKKNVQNLKKRKKNQ